MLKKDFDKTPVEVASILGVVDTYLRWNNKSGPPRKYDIYHPSAFGKCLRQMQYKRYADAGHIVPIGKEFESRILRLFEKGHNMQSRWERYFTSINILRGLWKCANPLCKDWDDNGNYTGQYSENLANGVKEKYNARMYGLNDKLGCFKPDKCVCGSPRFDYHELSIKEPELNMFGHADLILDFSRFDQDQFDGVFKSFNITNLPSKPIVVDMKTINKNGFESMTTYKGGPHFGYQIQLLIYMHSLGCEYGIILYECKDNSEVAAYRIDRNEEAWEFIKSQANLMNQMAEAEDGNGDKLNLLPPPRVTKKSSYECKNCEFKKYCHSGAIWKDKDLNNKRKKFYGELLESK
jgi:hypothetical protein